METALMSNRHSLVIALALLACAARASYAQHLVLASVDPAGSPGNGYSGFGPSFFPPDFGPPLQGLAISGDGRFVAFYSQATNLVAGVDLPPAQIYVRDMWSNATELVSASSMNQPGDGASVLPALSRDGRFVAFASKASNLVAGDTNNRWDVFVRDRLTHRTERVSVDSSGNQGLLDSGFRQQQLSQNPPPVGVAISDDGSRVAFASLASNLAPGNSEFDQVYVHDRRTGRTSRVSVDANGIAGNKNSNSPSISGDGRCVGFSSDASNLIEGDTNHKYDAFVRDLSIGVTTRVSTSSSGAQGDDMSFCGALSADGRWVSFSSWATNFVAPAPSGENGYVRDRLTGVTTLETIDMSGAAAGGGAGAISDDGRFVLFVSDSGNIVPGDFNDTTDVFLRDRRTGEITLVSLGASGNTSVMGAFYSVLATGGRAVAFVSFGRDLLPPDANAANDVYVRLAW